MVSLWSKISNLGVDKADLPSLKRKIRISNQFAFFALLPISISMVSWFSRGETFWGVYLATTYPIFAIGYYLNHKGYNQIGRTLFMVKALTVVFVFANASGQQGGDQYYFFTGIAAAFTIFSNKERWPLIFTVSLTIVYITLLAIFDFKVFSIRQNDPFESIMFFYLNLFFAILLLVLYLSIHMKNLRVAEEKLISQNQELRNTTERLIDTQIVLAENQEKIRSSKSDIERALKIKTDFLSKMSHEIRTPLNSINGFTQLLQNDEIEINKVKQYSNLIRKSSSDLMVIINDILDFEKLESGKLVLEEIPFEFQESLKELCEPFEHLAKQKEIDFCLSITPEVCGYVIGDPVRFGQIINNLLSNALKFTDQGYVKVEANKQHVKGKDQVEIVVKDSGIGISEFNIGKIFESFSQAESNIVRKYGGTGLGLTIVKELVELYGGDIQVASVEGKGTKFTLTIPFEFTNETVNTSQVNYNSLENNELEGLNVLIVEDTFMNQMLFEQFMQIWGASYELAEDGGQALELLRKKVFDVILLDLQMPDMTGFDVIKEIQAEKTLNTKTPVIAVTADAFESTRNKVMQAGFYEFVSKPIDKGELFEHLNTIKNKVSSK